MPKISSALILILFTVAAQADQSLSALLEVPAKYSEINQKKCDEELKALPRAQSLAPADLVKAMRAVPVFPKDTATMFETLSESTLPTDKDDLKKASEQIDAAPTCWDDNSFAIIGKGSRAIVAKGTKRQKEDFTAALVNRLRSENKKQLLLLPLVVALDALEQLAQANLLNASVKDEIHQASARAQDLAHALNEKYPNAADEKDPKDILSIRRAELSSSRQVQALLDSILKKI